MLGLEIVSHYVTFVYEIRSHATQFRFCMRSNFCDTIAFYLFSFSNRRVNFHKPTAKCYKSIETTVGNIQACISLLVLTCCALEAQAGLSGIYYASSFIKNGRKEGRKVLFSQCLTYDKMLATC